MIIVLLADGFEEIEALTPVDMLRRAGLSVKTVGINGKIAIGSHNIPVVCDATSHEINLSDVSMAIFPGGMPGSLNLDASPYTDEVINSVLDRGGHIAAICAAPLVFGKRGLLDGKKATCYPGFEKELIGATVTGESVVTDGNITTARGMGVAVEFAEELVKICVGQQRADEISRAICKSGSAPSIVIEQESSAKISTVLDSSSYTAPALDLLESQVDYNSESLLAESKQVADKLAKILHSADIEVSTEIERGPRLTRIHVTPSNPAHTKKIVRLSDDIHLLLDVVAMRIKAPAPGEEDIIFEIPNETLSDVKLRPLIESEEFKSAASCTTVCVGRDVVGKAVVADIAKMPHSLIGGMAASGKTALIKSMITSLTYKASPSEVKLIIIDPRGCEFIPFEGIPHLLTPVISSPSEAAAAIEWVYNEMERRYSLLSLANVRSIDAYNQKRAEESACEAKLHKIVVVIDELGDIMATQKSNIETMLMRIAQKSRAAGIYTLIATRRTSPNAISGSFRVNIPTRFCFKVASNVDSRMMLDCTGAEMLLGHGDALYYSPSSPNPIRIQGAVVSNDEIEKVTTALKRDGIGLGYDPTLSAYIINKKTEFEKEAQNTEKVYYYDYQGEDYMNNRQFLDAVEVVLAAGKASTSLIQRKLSIGYGKAAKFLDIMEDMGIVSEVDGANPRNVIISADEWKERLATVK